MPRNYSAIFTMCTRMRTEDHYVIVMYLHAEARRAKCRLVAVAAMALAAGFDIGTRNMAVFIGRFNADGRVAEAVHFERCSLRGDRLWQKELDAGRWVEDLAAQKGLAGAKAIGVEQQVLGVVHAQKAQSAVLGALGSLGLAPVTRVVHGSSKGAGGGGYRERKKRAVELAREASREVPDALQALACNKPDDLADALLIARVVCMDLSRGL